jgi:hypothetical protein
MSASLIASFFSFLLTGIYTYWIASFELTINSDIKVTLFFAILANAFYFFYIEALTEVDEDMQARLRQVSIWQWILRIFNQFILFSLWFLLQWNELAFAIGLIILYISFIVWDRITDEYKNNKLLYFTDIGGLVLTVGFLVTTYLVMINQSTDSSPKEGYIIQPSIASSIQFYHGAFVILYLLVPIVGLGITKFALFRNGYWSKDKIT